MLNNCLFLKLLLLDIIGQNKIKQYIENAKKLAVKINCKRLVYSCYWEIKMVRYIFGIAELGISLLLMYYVLRIWNANKKTMTLKEIGGAWQIERSYNKASDVKSIELAKIRHDLNQHFLVLQELIARKDYTKAMNMLETLREHVSATKENEYCKDNIVNAIMGECEHICNENNVIFKCDLAINDALRINPVVVCSVFSNLTRNAVEAAKKVEGSGAFVVVKAKIDGDYLLISVENACVNRKKAGWPDKRQKYGFDILSAIVEEHHGKIEMLTDENRYCVKVFMKNIDIT